MTDRIRQTLNYLDENAALREILQGTASATGHPFFEALVEHLSKALGTHAALVTEYIPESDSLRALAFWVGGQLQSDYEYTITGTPCEPVVREGKFFHHPRKVQSMFYGDNDLSSIGAVSYMGVALTDMDGNVIGTLAIIDNQPMPEEPRGMALFHIFGGRAAAELRRLQNEDRMRDREVSMGRLLDKAADAIIELNDSLIITHMNQSAGKALGCDAHNAAETPLRNLLSPDSFDRIQGIAARLQTRPQGQQYGWMDDGLETITGNHVSIDASLSYSTLGGTSVYTLVLRPVDEAKTNSENLTLNESSNPNTHNIVGTSPSIMRVLTDIDQVAGTTSTVLINGETGTGKELVARAIHSSSTRPDQPLVRVNCAAIPAALIESEFFGHEKGAFTGATEHREGRFALADGGTIFLDEVGELPLDVQAKLLRVLQEGEFEPVGSSQSKKVDVRIIAATNRDLLEMAQQKTFREDLYYRLNVFPILVPPLRERRDDIPSLAASFAQRISKKIGRTLSALTDSQLERLLSHDWPGNVRELENIIERGIIASRDGSLNFDRAFPSADSARSPVSQSSKNAPRIRTVDELQQLERQNILLALEATDWKVAGEGGAAEVLGMKPSTLTSRIKALGIRRPATT